MAGNSNIEKLTEPFFAENFIFGPQVGQKDPEWA